MSLTYVIPDIHGRFDLLSEALHRVHAYAAGNGGTLVMLGDYVDKGPDSNKIIARLRRGMPEGWRFVTLKGNHDAMMVAARRDPANMARWLEHGGDAVVQSYGGDPSAIPEADIAWLEALPLMHIDAHRIYVHAGVDPGLAPDAQPETTLLWKRYPKGDPAGFEGRHVVHGHNSFVQGPELYQGRTNLDTRAWRTRRFHRGSGPGPGALADQDAMAGKGPVLQKIGPRTFIAYLDRSDLTTVRDARLSCGMGKISDSVTKLQATFRIKVNGESVAIATVGQAYDFITRLNSVEWMEFRALHEEACAALEAAADNAMMSRKATDVLRALFARANLL